MGTERKAADYAVDMDDTNTEKEQNLPTDGKKTGFSNVLSISRLGRWHLVDEEAVKTENGTRSFMTFGGRKNSSLFRNQQLDLTIK